MPASLRPMKILTVLNVYILNENAKSFDCR